MEFIKFLFSSFWVWAGFLLLVYVALNGVAEIVRAIRGKKDGDGA